MTEDDHLRVTTNTQAGQFQRHERWQQHNWMARGCMQLGIGGFELVQPPMIVAARHDFQVVIHCQAMALNLSRGCNVKSPRW